MNKSLEIQIQTTDRNLDFEMMETTDLSEGQQTTLSDGNTVAWTGAALKKAATEPYVFTLVVSLVSGVGVGMVSNFLYDKLKGKSAKLRINRIEVEIEKDKITRIMVEQIEKED